MEKKKTLWYWIITVALSFFIFSGGLAQALQVEGVVKGFKPLGYPTYFISIIGVWKMLGVIAILIPRFKLLKEWAYAGIFFTMTGAIISHIASNDISAQIVAPFMLAVFAVLSWYLRPADRKIISVN
ncbi:DoxX family protein [Mucilaginibacter lappiensis]|uniref:Membrane protein n=1 Tax=Mucilaginibacter lappiensis TaxID=354630 RepID=A0A1N6VIS2_9SPHI|nr:DoxX family protein [Mucilaginibacter lappiensis]MBB6109151.1 putative membrane protein [Mucilaginibacter lappiensis]MBB6127256.1 putative membrane protein [Mucilaginibacter lappiensis]SIQ77638.1 DoxX-like family protein [Mucilaginibacter lappiensis]